MSLRTIEESPEATQEVLEEVRAEAPEAAPVELVATAAGRIEAEEAEAEEEAAVQIGVSAAGLREATERLTEDRPS